MAVRNPDDRDFVKIAKEYARKAVRDKKGNSHGLLIRQAAQRFLDDLKRARSKDCAFIFDNDYAAHPCRFIERLPHVEGRWEPPTIVLHPAQIFFVIQLFGFRNRADPSKRRFTSALYATARKSAKSTLAAAIMLYCKCWEDEPGAQLISAATTHDQASIIWGIAKKMVDATPLLREEFGLESWARSISRAETGASFKAVHSKASTQDGLNPSHVSLDEIHAHKTADLVNVLTSAAGARENPLWLYTTTEGYLNPGPWAEIRLFVRRLLDGVFGNEADHYLAVFFAVDEENKSLGIKADDDFDESKWVKANPLIDVNPNLLTAIRKEAIEAKQMPSKLAEFRIKRLNRQASTAEGWINLPKWLACSGPVDLDALRDVPCYGGLDLASTSDIASFRLQWKVDGVYFTHGFRFVPEDAVAYRTERATVPYAGWVEDGHLIQTEGNVTDYEVIRKTVLECCEKFNIQLIAYDRWNAQDLINRLSEEDVPLIEFVQGPKSYHPAMQELELHYMAGNLAHGGDPVLNWCASNVVARRDVNLNMAPDRKNSADKIDDIAALLMSIGVTLSEEREPEREYQFIVF